MSVVLITGGAGFIGANFIHFLRRHRPDWRLINLDLLTYAGNLENLAAVATHLKHLLLVRDLRKIAN